MDFVRVDIFLVSFISAFVAVVGKIVWDWFQTGRVSDIYLKKEEFLQHKRECCVLDLKKEFQAHKESNGRHDADSESRLRAVEAALKEGRADFKTIREDINAINLSLRQITTILEYKWGKDLP